MSKINKYANLYDKDGNLLRHVNEDGILPDYTIEELEELVDNLANDKDENGNIRNPQALNNANLILIQYYQKYGNPHISELLSKLQKDTKNQAIQALEETKAELEEKDNNDVSEEQTDIVETPENQPVMDGEMSENIDIVEEDTFHPTIDPQEGEYVEFEEVE